jgi:hypothetical protein
MGTVNIPFHHLIDPLTSLYFPLHAVCGLFMLIVCTLFTQVI